MAPAERSDDELLAATRRDPEAFGVFYRRHGEAVFRYMLFRTRSAEEASELTAEVFAAALLPVAPKYRDRFAWLPHALRVRVFQHVVPGTIAPDNGRFIVIRATRWGNASESHPFRTPRRGNSGLLPP